jgi:hypothetical protein
LEWKMFVIFWNIWNILRQFDIIYDIIIVCGNWVHFLRIGMFGPRKIWQPWIRDLSFRRRSSMACFLRQNFWTTTAAPITCLRRASRRSSDSFRLARYLTKTDHERASSILKPCSKNYLFARWSLQNCNHENRNIFEWRNRLAPELHIANSQLKQTPLSRWDPEEAGCRDHYYVVPMLFAGKSWNST